MDIIGRWALKALNVPSADGLVTYTRDNVPADFVDTFEESAKMLLEFTADGQLNTVMAVDDELREMAAAEGMEIPEGAEYFPVMSTTWEERDGKLFYVADVEGEIMGEAIDPNLELTFTENGDLLYNYGLATYEKV